MAAKSDSQASSGVNVVWITRHGEREDVADPQWFEKPQRSYDDPPLAEKGRVQARELAQRLLNEQIDHIFASPFERCVETAQIVSSARANPLPIKLEPGICEVLWDFPPGYLPSAELKQKYALVDTAWKPLVVPQEWEPTSRHCYGRVAATMEALRGGFSGSLLLVAHGAPIGAMMQEALGKWRRVGVCTLSKLTRNEQGGWRADFVGDYSHLTDRSNLRAYW